MIKCDGEKCFEMSGNGGIILAEFGFIASELYKSMIERGISPRAAISVLHESIEAGITAAEVLDGK